MFFAVFFVLSVSSAVCPDSDLGIHLYFLPLLKVVTLVVCDALTFFIHTCLLVWNSTMWTYHLSPCAKFQRFLLSHHHHHHHVLLKKSSQTTIFCRAKNFESKYHGDKLIDWSVDHVAKIEWMWLVATIGGFPHWGHFHRMLARQRVSSAEHDCD